MRRRRLIVALLGVMLFGASIASVEPAHAEQPDDISEGEVAEAIDLNEQILAGEIDLSDLSSRQVEVLSELGQAVSVDWTADTDTPLTNAETPGVGTMAANTCYLGRHDGVLKNALGMHLASYWYQMRWCTNSSNIVSSATVYRRGYDVQWVGWSFENYGEQWEDVRPPSSGATGGLAVTSQQFHFKYGVGDIAQHKYPCLRMVGSPTGSFSRYLSC